MAYGNFYGGWAPYVSVAQKRRNAAKEVAALKKRGQACQGVTIEGRKIAGTFWGKAWCDNLEAYSDYANRLPRGRSYVRNGAVIDLAIETGKVSALVSGSDLYRIEIGVQPLKPAHWKNVVKECGGKIDSLIELLQGRLSQAVMQVVTRRTDGLFPTPREITFRCSCPDSASMCKHIAATLYGIGARLDHQPELLFQLRHVDPQDLIQHAPSFPAATGPADSGRQLADSDLSKLFGIELDDTPAATDVAPARTKAAAKGPGRTRPVSGSTTAKPKTAEPRRAAAAARTRRIKKVLVVKVLSRRKRRGRKPKSG